MHEDRSEREEPGAFSEAQAQKAVLETLLDERFPWTVEELVRELSSERLDTIDAIASLEHAGLLHRIGEEFVFPTRAARRADEIADV
jgi:predicted transcriptional regulator